MAKQEQVEILKSGVQEWNQWRRNNNKEIIDLSSTNLRFSNLIYANLNSANLHHSCLVRANLVGANLMGARLNKANLFGADLMGAHLNGVDLSGANLDSADLYNVNLIGANLKNVTLDGTIFAFQNLSTCKGLESVKVKGECSIDFQTLKNSKNLPKSFLLKIGLPQNYIDYLPDFFDNSP